MTPAGGNAVLTKRASDDGSLVLIDATGAAIGRVSCETPTIDAAGGLVLTIYEFGDDGGWFPDSVDQLSAELVNLGWELTPDTVAALVELTSGLAEEQAAAEQARERRDAEQAARWAANVAAERDRPPAARGPECTECGEPGPAGRVCQECFEGVFA